MAALGPRPEKPLELYEFEACPFCRKAREALTLLDLDALVLPCPKGGPRFREEVKRRGGKYQFPYLVDPNTGKEMYESDEIVAYLFERYGAGRPPAAALARRADESLGRARLGAAARLRLALSAGACARAPARALELRGFAVLPDRARMPLEPRAALPAAQRRQGKPASAPPSAERSGKMMVPWLVDPNTGASMFESADIVRYLERTYAKPGA